MNDVEMNTKMFKLTLNTIFPVNKKTGWLNTDCCLFSSCPKCFQDEGYYCVTPKGRKAVYSHMERLETYRIRELNNGS